MYTNTNTVCYIAPSATTAEPFTIINRWKKPKVKDQAQHNLDCTMKDFIVAGPAKVIIYTRPLKAFSTNAQSRGSGSLSAGLEIHTQFLPPGSTHLISELGNLHGQSTGLFTHARVSSQMYPLQLSDKNKKIKNVSSK